MKSYCNCPAAGRSGPQAAAAAQQASVNRYSHPIRIKNSPASNSSEELLSYILETLSHHSSLLEELLRRTEKPDTM